MGYATDTKAKALVYAALHTDEQAAEKYGCGRRSINYWRDELDENQELQEACTRRWEEVRESDSWVQDATHTLRTAQAAIREAADKMDLSNPDALDSLTKAYGEVGNLLQMARIVDARLGANRQNGAEGGQDATRRLDEPKD